MEGHSKGGAHTTPVPFSFGPGWQGGTLVTADGVGLGMEDRERAVLGAREAQRKYYSVRNMCPGVKAFRELLFLHWNKLGKDGSFSSSTVKSFLAG